MSVANPQTLWVVRTAALGAVAGGIAYTIARLYKAKKLPLLEFLVAVGSRDSRFVADMAIHNKPSPDDGREQRLAEQVLSNLPRGDPAAILQGIDKYAWSCPDFLMLVGDVKGELLDRAVDSTAKPIKAALELGTYVGYSAVRIASRLKDPGAKFFSVDVCSRTSEVAGQLVEHAGLMSKVELLVSEQGLSGSLGALREGLAQVGVKAFDFVFIDHVKALYLSDLQLLLSEGLLAPGCVVVGDNLRVPGVPDYVAYMREGEGAQRFDTVFHDTELEYTKGVADMVAVSVFKG